MAYMFLCGTNKAGRSHEFGRFCALGDLICYLCVYLEDGIILPHVIRGPI
jgi:hypothetical protein